MITGFDCIVNEVCALLGSYTMQSGNYVPTLWDNLSVPPSRVQKSKKTSWLLKMGQIGHPKMWLWNYNFMLC